MRSTPAPDKPPRLLGDTKSTAAALSLLEKAIKLIFWKDFRRARAEIKALMETYPGEKEILAKARSYLLICDREEAALRKPAVTGDQLYMFGVVEHNRGNYESAISVFNQLLAKQPDADYLYYAMQYVHMQGYWKNPKETALVLRDGWLYTGDLARADVNGYFYLTDRKKDLIKHNGYSIYPREIEDLLYEHPAVKLCAVIGKPDLSSGEVPQAFVVLKQGIQTSEQELKDFVNQKIAPYKALREIKFRQDLPLGSAGKILKRLLKEQEMRP